MKTKLLIYAFLTSLILLSCSKDKEENTDITADEIKVNAKIDLAADDMQSIVEDEYSKTTANPLGAKTAETYGTNACPAVSRVPAFGTALTVGTQVTKTIDFGTSCIYNGHILKGKIIITFVYNPSATTQTITYTADNFYHNDFKIEGSKTFTRTMTAATSTSASHPKVEMQMNLTVTNTTNGNVYTRTGSRTRELIEGFSTLDLSDNIWQITGSWTTTYPNLSPKTTEITTPLIYKYSCGNISKGVIKFTRNNNTATLDYGNGTCDNLATFTTASGITITIILN